ncbi:MAG: PEGA domain-containing protein [Deltaproteobacteria bacterium]|nr:MAG: PEGA domain-containing protein [Deltaproteobacteria bacterium]
MPVNRRIPTSALVYPLLSSTLLMLLAGTARPSSAREKMNVAIVGIRSQEILAEDLDTIYSTLIQENRRFPEYHVISTREIEQQLGASASREAALQQALALWEEGKAHYLKLEFDSAIATLEEAMHQLEENPTAPLERVTDTLLYLALSYRGKGEEETASRFLRDLIRLDPDIELDQAMFPPDVLEAVEAARSAVANLPKGRLFVESTPEAEVWVAGKSYGQTPVEISDLPVGRTLVRLSREGYRPRRFAVEVTEEGTKISESLEMELTAQSFDQMLRALHKKHRKEKEALAERFGKFIDADLVLVGDVSLHGQHYNLDVFYCDLRNEPKRCDAFQGPIAIDLSDARNRIIQLSALVRKAVLEPASSAEEATQQAAAQEEKAWPEDALFYEPIPPKKEPWYRGLCLF